MPRRLPLSLTHSLTHRLWLMQQHTIQWKKLIKLSNRIESFSSRFSQWVFASSVYPPPSRMCGPLPPWRVLFLTRRNWSERTSERASGYANRRQQTTTGAQIVVVVSRPRAQSGILDSSDPPSSLSVSLSVSLIAATATSLLCRVSPALMLLLLLLSQGRKEEGKGWVGLLCSALLASFLLSTRGREREREEDTVYSCMHRWIACSLYSAPECAREWVYSSFLSLFLHRAPHRPHRTAHQRTPWGQRGPEFLFSFVAVRFVCRRRRRRRRRRGGGGGLTSFSPTERERKRHDIYIYYYYARTRRQHETEQRLHPHPTTSYSIEQ